MNDTLREILFFLGAVTVPIKALTSSLKDVQDMKETRRKRKEEKEKRLRRSPKKNRHKRQ